MHEPPDGNGPCQGAAVRTAQLDDGLRQNIKDSPKLQARNSCSRRRYQELPCAWSRLEYDGASTLISVLHFLNRWRHSLLDRIAYLRTGEADIAELYEVPREVEAWRRAMSFVLERGGVMQLRHYQLDLVERSHHHCRPCLVMPTGAGKTPVASEIIRCNPDWHVLFLADRRELIHQAKEKLADFGVKAGLIIA